MKKVFLLCFVSLNCFSYDASVLVLEAPLFSKTDKNSKVVQYLRKGDKVYIHDSEVMDKSLLSPQVNYYPQDGNDFYKTISRNGKVAYILKEHIRIHYNDKRDFLPQNNTQHDNTDYRIKEPISDDFPFIRDSGYRGQLSYGLGPANFSNYPFRQRIRNSSTSYSKELNMVWAKAMSQELTKRFYLGIYASYTAQSGKYSMPNQLANQFHNIFTIGPYASYDNYTHNNTIISMFTSLQVSLIDTMEINIKDDFGDEETRTYSSRFSLVPSTGINMQFKKSFFALDTVIGSHLKLHLPKRYISPESAENSKFWVFSQQKDYYDQPLLVELNIFAGIQAFY